MTVPMIFDWKNGLLKLFKCIIMWYIDIPNVIIVNIIDNANSEDIVDLMQDY